MKGHIRKRGDAWEPRVYVGVDAVTGKKRYATKSIPGGKRDAERALVELAADAQRGKLSRTNTTVAELLDARPDDADRIARSDDECTIETNLSATYTAAYEAARSAVIEANIEQVRASSEALTSAIMNAQQLLTQK